MIYAQSTSTGDGAVNGIHEQYLLKVTKRTVLAIDGFGSTRAWAAVCVKKELGQHRADSTVTGKKKKGL